MANLAVPSSRKMVVAMKAETAYGVDIFAGSYTAADIVPAFDIRPSQPPQVIENLSQGGHLGRLPNIVNLPTAQVSFAMNLRGKGVAYSASTKPESDMPFRACGMSSTFSGGSGAEIITYIPTDTHESFTIYVIQQNGTALKLVGAFGTFSAIAPLGAQRAELFSTDVRTSAGVWLNNLGVAGAVIGLALGPLTIDQIGLAPTVTLLGVAMLGASLAVMLLPETRGKPIDVMAG